MKWYAVMTNPRCEEIANRNLKRAGYHTFYPFERVRRRRKRANVDKFIVEWINTPYFPGYLFVGLKDGQGLYDVNEAEGVSTVVYCGDVPLEIPHAVMDELMAREFNPVDKVSRGAFQPGQKVRFQDNHPLAGLLAQIVVDRGTQVVLWAKMLGGHRQISVDPSAVAEIA